MKLQNEGFTLLEVVIVLAIMGIIFTYVIPTSRSLQEDHKLYTFARSCVEDLRYAQQLSIDTKDEYGVYFTTTGYQVKNGEEVIKTVNFDYVTYSYIDGSSVNEIVFKSDGEPYESGKINFKSNYSDTRIYVNVTPETGEVSESWQ